MPPYPASVTRHGCRAGDREQWRLLTLVLECGPCFRPPGGHPPRPPLRAVRERQRPRPGRGDGEHPRARL